MRTIVLNITLYCLVLLPAAVHSHSDANKEPAPETDHSAHQHDGKPAPPAAAGDHHHHGAAWPVPEEMKQRANPMAATAESVERGEALFATHCASCHGPGGRGDGPATAGLAPPPPDLVMSADHHPGGELAYKIAEGRGMMPSWKPVLESDQIWDLVNYLQSLAK